MFPSIEQIKAARALLKWTQTDLAAHAGLGDDQVRSFESGRTHSLDVLTAIERAVTASGIEFTRDGGLRPRKHQVLTFDGRDGFAAFRADIIAEGHTTPLDVCVSNVDERQFDTWGAGRVNDEYFNAMRKMPDLHFRTLVQDGDTHLSGPEYMEYRWLPRDQFGAISFFIYGQKTAIITFENDTFQAFVIAHPDITAFYRKDFEKMWAHAKPVTTKGRA